MPFRGPVLHFSDILDAILWIDRYVEGMSFDNYDKDVRTKDAVERRLQIVTEAIIRLGTDATLYSAEVRWNDWRGLGNVLRHGYHKINDRIIWHKVHEELPLLKRVSLDALSKLKNEK